MPGTSTKTKPVQFRLTPADVADLTAIAAAISPAGVAISNAGALRFSISAAKEKLKITGENRDFRKSGKKSAKNA